jgi:hypothetical protein
MSGSVGLVSTAFTDAEKADIRRFCGYPAYGAGAAGFNSWRFFQAFGLLEYRMTNFRPEEFQVCRLMLSQLYPLELAIYSSTSNLDTDQAAVWTHNKREVADRMSLYRQWRRELCGIMGVPPGPALGNGGGSITI